MIKQAAVKSAKVVLWPVKTPKRLIFWLIIGVLGLAVFFWGATALMKARSYLPDQIVSRIAPPVTVPEPPKPTPALHVEDLERYAKPIPEDQDVMKLSKRSSEWFKRPAKMGGEAVRLAGCVKLPGQNIIWKCKDSVGRTVYPRMSWGN